MKFSAVRWVLGFCLLLLTMIGLSGCGGGDGASADANALKSVGWYYENIAPDVFNNGTTCYLTLNLHLTDAVSSADIDSFIISTPSGGGWNISASGRQASTTSNGTTYFPLLLRFENPHAFPLAGVWTITVKLKDGRTSSVQKTLHDPGGLADATYRYLYATEDWTPGADQSQYVPILKRFPAAGFSLQYSSADGGKITSIGFSAVRAAYLVAEPKSYNMFYWLYDENKTYLGYTTSAYSVTDHSGSDLITSEGEIAIVPSTTTAANAGYTIGLSLVKYVRVVVVDGAQFAPQSYSIYDNRSISALVPVTVAPTVPAPVVPAPVVPAPVVPAPVAPAPVAPVSIDSNLFQSQVAKYTMSMPKVVNYGDVVPITITVANTGNFDINIQALPVRVYLNNVQIYFSINVISSGDVNIKPGDTKILTTSWSNKDNAGNSVPTGSYALVCSCMSYTESTDLRMYFTIQ